MFVYSRKQLWSHQKKRIRRNFPDELYKTAQDISDSKRSFSDPTILRESFAAVSEQQQQLCDHFSSDCISSSLRNHRTSRIKTSQKSRTSINSERTQRSVRFGNSVNVVLIPTREEYQRAGFDEKIWWQRSELKAFKESANEEFKGEMRSSRKKKIVPVPVRAPAVSQRALTLAQCSSLLKGYLLGNWRTQISVNSPS